MLMYNIGGFFLLLHCQDLLHLYTKRRWENSLFYYSICKYLSYIKNINYCSPNFILQWSHKIYQTVALLPS